MESSRPAAADSSATRGRWVSAAVYVALLLLAAALYAWLARPLFEPPESDAALHLLSRLLGSRVFPSTALASADRTARAVLLLSVFPFAVWLFGARLATRRTVVLALLLVGAGIRLSVALQDPIAIRRWPLDDDSHYYFNIAWNLANGHGLRHDSFHTTTGVQPLFLLLITPLYWLIASKPLAVTAVLVLQTGLGVVLGASLAALVREVAGDAAAVFAAAVSAFSLLFVSIDLNGLETGLALSCVCWVALVYLRALRAVQPPSGRGWLGLGALLGVTFLARVDTGLLGAAIALHALIANPWGQPRARIVRGVSAMTAAAVVLALPWLLLNLSLVGSVLPGGGQAVRFLSQAYGYRMMVAAGPPFDIDRVPLAYYRATLDAALRAIRWLAADAVSVRPALAVAALGFCLGLAAALGRLRRLAFLWTFLALLVTAYVSYVFGQWYFERYLAPFALGYLLVLAIGLKGLLQRFESAGAERAQRALLVATAVALTITLVSDVVTVTTARPRRPRGFYDAAQWINRNTPANAVVAGFQTGIFGYYVERPFCGLDGKINIDALDALRERQIDRYVQEQAIEYLVDWPFVFEDLFVARSRDPGFLARQQQVYSNGDVVVYHLGGAAAEPGSRP